MSRRRNSQPKPPYSGMNTMYFCSSLSFVTQFLLSYSSRYTWAPAEKWKNHPASIHWGPFLYSPPHTPSSIAPLSPFCYPSSPPRQDRIIPPPKHKHRFTVLLWPLRMWFRMLPVKSKRVPRPGQFLQPWFLPDHPLLVQVPDVAPDFKENLL